jgi:hypothetical protein
MGRLCDINIIGVTEWKPGLWHHTQTKMYQIMEPENHSKGSVTQSHYTCREKCYMITILGPYCERKLLVQRSLLGEVSEHLVQKAKDNYCSQS